MTFRVKALTWYYICRKFVQVVVCYWLLMRMLSFMGIMLICDREMMVPENGGMSVKEGKILYCYLIPCKDYNIWHCNIACCFMCA